jgi:hypothetical protein
MLPKTLATKEPAVSPALVASTASTLSPRFPLSYDTASVRELNVLPTVSATRSVPGSDGLALQAMAVLDSHPLDSHPVIPARVRALSSPPP